MNRPPLDKTRNHIALLFHSNWLKITPHYYFNEIHWGKPHHVAISMKLLENHIALLFHRSYSKITSRCYFTEVTRKSHRVAISDEITQNHTALLFHKKLLKITLRCYFTRNYTKSHHDAISMKVWIVFRELMIFILNGKNFQWNHISIRRRLGGKQWIENFPKKFLTLWKSRKSANLMKIVSFLLSPLPQSKHGNFNSAPLSVMSFSCN